MYISKIYILKQNSNVFLELLTGLNTKRQTLETEDGFEIREESPIFGKKKVKERELWQNNTFFLQSSGRRNQIFLIARGGSEGGGF